MHIIIKNTSMMESQPLLKEKEETSMKDVDKSHIGNLMFGNLILFIHTLAAYVHFPVQSQYLYRRVSADIFGNSSIVKNQLLNQTCYLNTSDPGYILQEKAQEITAEKQMHYTIVQSTIALFTTILLGAYSDYVGRKVLFAGPLIGHFMRYAGLTIIIYWNLDLNYFFLIVSIDGLFGGYYAILLACNAYAADNTPATGSRTMGIAFVGFIENIGAAVSSTATGYVIQDTGFFYPMLVATCLCLLDVILVLVAFPERPKLRMKRESFCFSPFDALKKVFGFYLFDGDKLTKVCFILGMIVFIFTCLPVVGGSNLDTLFKLNIPFCWSPEMIGYYSTASSVVQQVLGVPLTRLLQCCCLDEVIGIIGSLASAGADALQGFANNNFMMYTVAAVTIPAATLYPIIRSMLSRLAPVNQQGALFASLAVIQSVCTLVGTPIFGSIYRKTVEIWRGFVFIIMASVHVIAAIFLVVFTVVSKPERQKRMVNTVSVQGRTEGVNAGENENQSTHDVGGDNA